MAAVFLAVDLIWLGGIAKDFYKRHLGKFFRDKVNWTAALTFYFLFVFGVLIFAVYPGLTESSLTKAVLFGVLFGLFTYATYDLTNLATLKDWPLTVVLVDIIWGMVLCGTTSAVGFLMASWLA
jgi:uncharacterized membrane protein